MGLKKIDNCLGAADRKARLLSRLNPTNINSQRRKFLRAYARGEEYNPFFHYAPAKPDLNKLKYALASLRIKIPSAKDEQWFFSRHLENKRRRTIKKIRCIQNIGSKKFGRYSVGLFGTPSASQIKYAKGQFNDTSRAIFPKVQDTIGDVGAAKILQQYATDHALPWKIKLRKNMASKAGLDSRSKYLLIKKGECFAPGELASLAVHEIETHIFRKENGALQRLPSLFSGGFAGPPTTEEGLAFFNEDLGQHDPRRALLVAARTIAAHLARRQSFYGVFDALCALGLPLPYAWNVTARVKRGLSDTSGPGSFTKDHHYLKGYLEVKNFLRKGGDMRLLYIGKLNISNAESLAKLGIEIKEPRYLPRHLENVG
jgi:uncharacterized protein (TIGR02421 family)